MSRSRTAPARRAKTPIHIAAGKSALQRSPFDLDSLAQHPSRSSRTAGHWLPRSHGEHERSSARGMVAARSSLAGAAPATIESVPCYTRPDFASVSIEQSARTILPMRPAPRQPGNPAMEGRGGRQPRPASRPAPGKVTRTSLLSPSRGGVDPRELAAPIPEVTAAPAAGAGSAVLQLRSAETAPARAGTTSDSLSFDEAKAAILAEGASMEAIYAAIRRCTDRPRLAADSGVQSLLRARFSGHDYWKALLLLAYGSEAAFPDAIKEIWAATAGWGADAERIYRALQALSPADVALIGAVPGLMDIIRSELGGQDLTAAQDLLAGTYAQAIKDHRTNVAFVATELANMRSSPDPVAANTAEWLQPTAAGATPKNELYVLTPTHDSSARATEHGQNGKNGSG